MAFGWIIMMLLLASCEGQKKKFAPAIRNRDSLPVLSSYDVNTLISDSGIIRYRLKTKEWLIYDKTNPPRWAFKKGIYVEQFDSVMNIEANMKADTAYFYDQQKLWHLIGHVLIKNWQGEYFKTSELFWNQLTEKIYSDKFIEIELKDRIVKGTGFESNQQMTVYKIKNIKATIYVNTHSKDSLKAEPVK